MRAMTEENLDLEFKFGRPLVNVKVIVPSFEELKISLKKKKKEKASCSQRRYECLLIHEKCVKTKLH